MADQGFFAEVYALVARIPLGKVMSYGQVAAVLGGRCSARYVGYAVASAPRGHNLPCHRVVNRLGEMAPGNIFGGSGRQRGMLEREGVLFLENGRVDMAKCMWRGEG